MSADAVKRCNYQFETATGRCCLADGHDGKHQLYRDDWVDKPMQALDDATVASLLKKESGPVSPAGAFLSKEQLTEIVARRKANRDSLWKAALEKHQHSIVEGSFAVADEGICVCGFACDWQSWIEHVAANLEDIR